LNISGVTKTFPLQCMNPSATYTEFEVNPWWALVLNNIGPAMVGDTMFVPVINVNAFNNLRLNTTSNYNIWPRTGFSGTLAGGVCIGSSVVATPAFPYCALDGIFSSATIFGSGYGPPQGNGSVASAAIGNQVFSALPAQSLSGPSLFWGTPYITAMTAVSAGGTELNTIFPAVQASGLVAFVQSYFTSQASFGRGLLHKLSKRLWGSRAMLATVTAYPLVVAKSVQYNSANGQEPLVWEPYNYSGLYSYVSLSDPATHYVLCLQIQTLYRESATVYQAGSGYEMKLEAINACMIQDALIMEMFQAGSPVALKIEKARLKHKAQSSYENVVEGKSSEKHTEDTVIQAVTEYCVDNAAEYNAHKDIIPEKLALELVHAATAGRPCDHEAFAEIKAMIETEQLLAETKSSEDKWLKAIAKTAETVASVALLFI